MVAADGGNVRLVCSVAHAVLVATQRCDTHFFQLFKMSLNFRHTFVKFSKFINSFLKGIIFHPTMNCCVIHTNLFC